MNRRYVHVLDAPGRDVLLRGTGLRDWLRDNGIPAMRSGVERGWWLRRDRLADVVAMLERDGFVVRPKVMSR